MSVFAHPANLNCRIDGKKEENKEGGKVGRKERNKERKECDERKKERMTEGKVKRVRRKKKEQKKQTSPVIWVVERSFSLVNSMGNHTEVKNDRCLVDP